MSTTVGVLQLLAQTVAADTRRWWGFALTWHRGQWSATVVPAGPSPDSADFEEDLDGLDPHEELEDVVSPNLWEAVAFIARTIAGPAPSAGSVDPDLLAVEALVTSRASAALVVAYDAVVDGVPGEEWEVYGSGSGGALYANGDTCAEALAGVTAGR